MVDCIKLYNNDCIDILKKLVDENIKVDAIITDPPYEINYKEWDNANSLHWDVIFDLFDKVTKDDANIIMFQGWSSVCHTLSKLPNNLILKNWIIYDRIKGRGAKTNLVSTREDILWIIKDKKNYTYNKIPSNIKKKTGGLGKRNGNQFRALSNVWTDISPIVPWSKERVNHPTQKPCQLLERCLKIWTNENDTILDPFMGSGTTGVTCVKNNRNFIGVELDKNYFDIATNRIEESIVI